MIADPKAFFFSLVREGANAMNYKTILRDIEQRLYNEGIGQLCGMNGDPRGRLFLPTAASGSCAPRNEAERHLGVKQEAVCWIHYVDVMNGSEAAGTLTWTWKDSNAGGPYVPINGEPLPPVVDPPVVNPPSSSDLADINRKLDALLLRPAPNYKGIVTSPNFPGHADVKLIPE